jgi:hypothetical protein
MKKVRGGGSQKINGTNVRPDNNFMESTLSRAQAEYPENQKKFKMLNHEASLMMHPVVHRSLPSPTIIDNFVDSNSNPLVKGSQYIFANHFTPQSKFKGIYDKIVDQSTNELQFVNVSPYPIKTREFAKPKMIIIYGDNFHPILTPSSGGKRHKTRRRKSRRNRRTKSRRKL